MKAIMVPRYGSPDVLELREVGIPVPDDNQVLVRVHTASVNTIDLALGGHILAGLEKLKAKHPLIGDVRGKGLMLGIELVKDRATREPAKAECAQVLELCREMGLLLGKGGLHGSVIRFAPPMCITHSDADFMLEVFDAAFAGTAKVGA